MQMAYEMKRKETEVEDRLKKHEIEDRGQTVETTSWKIYNQPIIIWTICNQ